MDWQAVLTPWNMGGAVCGLLLGLAAIVSLALNRRQVAAALARIAQRLFSPVGFFGVVIVIFMSISTLESGAFFNRDITHGAIFGLLGYALALGFDLVSIVCMTARLNATRMRDERGARLNLVGVCICAAVSAFANLAGAVQEYQPADLNHTPAFIQVCAPWTSMVFPLLIVVLSMTTDHIVDHTPARGIDLQVFRERERKRVEMVQIRLETERELLTLDAELSLLRQKREQASGRVRREWVWMNWLRPVIAPPACAPEPERASDLSSTIDQAVQSAQAALETRLNEMNATLNTLAGTTNALLENVHTPENAHAPEPERAHSGEQERAPVQEKERASIFDQRPDDQEVCIGVGTLTHTQATRTGTAVQLDERDEALEPAEGPPTATAILTAFHRLGVQATDTDVAHETGYSRTTVARWRKRLLAQGQLSVSIASAQLTQISEAAREPDLLPREQ